MLLRFLVGGGRASPRIPFKRCCGDVRSVVSATRSTAGLPGVGDIGGGATKVKEGGGLASSKNVSLQAIGEKRYFSSSFLTSWGDPILDPNRRRTRGGLYRRNGGGGGSSCGPPVRGGTSTSWDEASERGPHSFRRGAATGVSSSVLTSEPTYFQHISCQHQYHHQTTHHQPSQGSIIGGRRAVAAASMSSTTSNTSGDGVEPPRVQVATTDLCDEYVTSPHPLHIVEPSLFQHYGAITKFGGPIETIRCYESNPLVRQTLSTPGRGRVLVVDGSNSKRVALLGDMLAEFGVDNGWAGIVLNGCLRDSAIIRTLPIGVMARGTYPLKSRKDNPGEPGVKVAFGGVEFVPGHWLYADEDGIIVSQKPLHENMGAEGGEKAPGQSSSL